MRKEGRAGVSWWRMSRPKARVRKAMGKCTVAGWMGLLYMGQWMVVKGSWGRDGRTLEPLLRFGLMGWFQWVVVEGEVRFGGRRAKSVLMLGWPQLSSSV